MYKIDDNIRQALQSNLQRIEDENFTQDILNIFLAKKQVVKNKSFFHLSPFIIGLSALICSIGLVVVLLQNYDWMKGIEISVENGLSLVVISSMFLIYKLLDDFIVMKSVSGSSVDR